MDLLKLNNNQRAAAEHTTGPMMTLAGPGSGKTTVITYRAVHLIRSAVTEPSRILVITYSKAASEQMRQRYEQLASSPRERGVTFGTFHAVFFKILRARFGYGLEQVLKEDERRNAVKKFLMAAGFAAEEDLLTSVLNELSLVKNELYDLRYYHSVELGGEAFKSLYQSYEEYKRERGTLDFDDMLTRCHSLLTQEAAVLSFWRKRFAFIMIDEFQDINRAQYEIVKLLAAPANNLFIVGDDDQSIYRFRGARPEFLLNFPKDYPGAAQVVLGTNYRSTDKIIGYSNSLIAGNTLRYGKDITGTGRKGVPHVLLKADDPNREAAAIAAQVKKIKNSGGDLGSVAVIYRLNMQARALVDAFLQANIPYQVKDQVSVIYEHWIARDIFAYLRLSRRVNPVYDADEERIVNKPYRFIGKAFLASVKQSGVSLFEAYHRDPALHDAQRTRLEELWLDIRAVGKREPAAAVRYIRQGAGYNDYIQSYSEYRKLDPTGLYEIADEIQDAAKQFFNAEDFLKHAEDAIANTRVNTDKQIPRVLLTTMHSAKGLEFDTVFIAGAAEGVIPHERSKTAAELEEERRLLYVGVTRARHELYISVPRTRYDKPVKPSRFLV